MKDENKRSALNNQSFSNLLERLNIILSMAFNNVEHIIDNLNNYMFTPKNLSVAQRNRIPQFRTSVVSK